MNPIIPLNEERSKKLSCQTFALHRHMKFLMFRLKLVLVSIIRKLSPGLIALLAFLFSENGNAQCNVGYTLYQSFQFNNSGPLVTNHQVKLTLNTLLPVSQGKMQASGNDIRFTDQQCNNLNYWIESGLNTSNTIIWVNVNTFTANDATTINMYVGNPSAPIASSGSATFESFDDFETGSLTGWSVFGAGSWSVVLYNGSMRLKGATLGTGPGTGATKYTGALGNYVVDVDYLNDNSSAMGGPLFEFTNATNYYAIHSMTAPSNLIMHSRITSGTANYSLSWPYTHSNNVWYKWSIERNASANAIYFDGNKIADLPRTFAEGAGVWGYGTSTAVIYFDNFRVRKYSSNITLTSATLPVTLTDLKANQQANIVEITWKAVQETNVRKYVIERSNAGINFTKAGEVAAKGNPSTDVVYNWKDKQPLNGNNFYRLKIIDFDGTEKLSNIRIVKFNGKEEFMTVSPNPLIDKVINITVGNIAAGKYEIGLYDEAGKKVYSSSMIHEGQSSNIIIRLPASITPGIHNLQISSKTLKLNKAIVIEK